MRFGIDVAPLGGLSDPRLVVRLARAAEDAGWDGISVWDNVGNSMGVPIADPFVTLAAVAANTQRLRLILSAVVLPRRRPHHVAQALGTLDELSDGRLVIGVAIGGDPAEFEAFGEPSDRLTRARKLEEGLGLVDAWLRGETVSHDGPAYVVRDAAVGPPPVQRPRPPIWVGAGATPGLRRAARWEGWIAVGTAEDGSIAMPLAPEDLARSLGIVETERASLGRSDEPFDVAILGYDEPGMPGRPADYAAAGATWWLESLHLQREPYEALLARVAAGPSAVPSRTGIRPL
ncbi:MAG TPA: LLM class flavin-dependent oxidoreductase [Candidatus Limnocylindrales bacterium]|nr:LLM class flavin-dependent oxidoreductase [Candidatus Limnocylindrales bacterium]